MNAEEVIDLIIIVIVITALAWLFSSIPKTPAPPTPQQTIQYTGK